MQVKMQVRGCALALTLFDELERFFYPGEVAVSGHARVDCHHQHAALLDAPQQDAMVAVRVERHVLHGVIHRTHYGSPPTRGWGTNRSGSGSTKWSICTCA